MFGYVTKRSIVMQQCNDYMDINSMSIKQKMFTYF